MDRPRLLLPLLALLALLTARAADAEEDVNNDLEFWMDDDPKEVEDEVRIEWTGVPQDALLEAEADQSDGDGQPAEKTVTVAGDDLYWALQRMPPTLRKSLRQVLLHKYTLRIT